MKFLFRILVVSLALNVALAAAYLARRPAPLVVAAPAADAPVSTAVSTSADDESAAVHWTSLLHTPGEALVARLRGGGFPPEVIRFIVSEQLESEFAERRKAVTPPPTPYWKKEEYERPLIDPELVPARRALERELTQRLSALLGPDAFEASDALTRRLYGDLPPEKIAGIKAINEDYAEIAEAVLAATKGVRLPEDDAKLAYLEEEKRADMATMLTPEEMLAYELRSSSASTKIRNQMQFFQPSEPEFVALFHVQREVDRELARLGRAITADELREFREARVQAVLSPERFAEYQTTTSGSYPEVSRLVESFKLPPNTAADVIRTQRETVRQANAVRNNPSLTSAQRQAQLAALSQAARTELAATLGPDAMNDYLRFAAARWLADLPPPPPATD